MNSVDNKISFPIVQSIVFPINVSCNLQCFGCNAGSNLGLSENFTTEQRLDWIDSLASVFDRFDLHAENAILLGGEPFLHRDLIEIMRHVKSRLPKSKIKIYTNGLLIDRSRDLLPEIAELGASLVITVHDSNKDHLAKIISGLLRLSENNILYSISNMSDSDLPEQLGGPAERTWIVPHPPDEDGKIHPANEENYLRSWSICTDRICPNVYDNAVWKCGPLAHLRNILAQRKQLDDPEWQPYLAYRPLRLDDPELDYDTVLEFFGRGAEPICSMCPAQNKCYSGKPVYRRDYAQFNPKKFHGIIGR